MTESQVRERILGEFPGAAVEVAGSGCNLRVRVEHAAFRDLAPVQRQRRVYRLFRAEIASGTLHSLSVEAQAPPAREAG